MTRTLISAGLVAAFGLSGNAFAQAISPADAAAAPTQIFLSGATAPSTIVRNVVKSTMCPSGFAEFSNGSKFYAIACNSSVTGGNAVFYYTSLGSNFGVQPALYNGTGADTIEAARRVQAEQEARAATKKFLGTGQAYTPK